MKKKTLFGIVVFCGLLGIGLAGIAIANKAVDGDEPAMMVSPNVIVLAKVSIITVHTNIPAIAVEPDSIDMDGVAPTGVGTDNCGHIVFKFSVAELGLEPGEVTLTLNGAFTEGGGFSVTDVVTVK